MSQSKKRVKVKVKVHEMGTIIRFFWWVNKISSTVMAVGKSRLEVSVVALSKVWTPKLKPWVEAPHYANRTPALEPKPNPGRR